MDKVSIGDFEASFRRKADDLIDTFKMLANEFNRLDVENAELKKKLGEKETKKD